MDTNTVEKMLQAAKEAGAEQAEVYHVATEETPVRFEANRLKELNSRQVNGVALRVIASGRIGFASSTRPGDVEDLVAAAMETSPFGPEAHFSFPGRTEVAAVETYDRKTEDLRPEDLITLGERLVEGVLKQDSDVLCDASVRRAVGTVTIANTSGASATHRSSALSAWVSGTLIRGTDMLFVGDADASCDPSIGIEAIIAEVSRQLERCQGNAATRTGEMPVVFTSLGVAEAIIGPLTMAFNGRNVLQGQSPLADALGEHRYDSRLTVTDDPTIPFRVGSRPFDDECLAARKVPLIQAGRVSNFLYDLQTAGMAGSRSTGSAHRSLTTQPSIGTSSLVVSPGDVTFFDMISGIEEGIVVEELMGAGQGNVMGGDFSGNVLLGYKIENGKLAGRVKNTIVAGNVHEALASVAAIGSETRWIGGVVNTPPICIDHLAVSAAS
jgi:PmbA protein